MVCVLRAYGISVQSCQATVIRKPPDCIRHCCNCDHYSCHNHSLMEDRPVFTNSNRTLSASVLKDRLSKLSVTPLRSVAALQARVECVLSYSVAYWHSHINRFGSPPACSFVPASIPRVRRLQTVAVALWTSMIPICFSFTLFLLYVHFLPLP